MDLAVHHIMEIIMDDVFIGRDGDVAFVFRPSLDRFLVLHYGDEKFRLDYSDFRYTDNVGAFDEIVEFYNNYRKENK